MNNEKVKIVVQDSISSNHQEQNNKIKIKPISEKISKKTTLENCTKLIFESNDEKTPSFILINEYIEKYESFSELETEMIYLQTERKNNIHLSSYFSLNFLNA